MRASESELSRKKLPAGRGPGGWIAAAGLGMGFGLLAVAHLGSQEPKGQVQILPGQARLELRGWTFGPNHTFIDGDYLHRLLLQGGDAFAVLGGYRATHEDMGNDLVLWFRGEEYSFPGRALRPAWIDPHGCRISTGSGWSDVLPHGALRSCRGAFWERRGLHPPEARFVETPRITPRRGQSPLRYAILDRSSPAPLAAFTVPGVPRASTDTAGTPAPLPIRSPVGDTTFVLKELRHEEPGRYPLSRSALAFAYEGTAPHSRSWRPVRVLTEDGTGNELVTTLGERWTGTSALCETLCRRDPAWKLSVRFARPELGGAPPDVVRTLAHIPVPARGEEVDLAQSFSAAGVGVRLELLQGSETAAETGWNWGVLQLNVAAPEGCQLRILRVTDQKHAVIFPRSPREGRRGELTADLSLNDSFGDHPVEFPLAYPRGTRYLNLTFGLYRTRTAEFIVQP